MLLRLSTLATGRTGVRPVVASTYAAMLSAGITPVVHEYGSLGCSGDLAPLAHCALALMGEGPVRDALRRAARRRRRAARGRASSRSCCTRRKGLALINGTDGMLGMLALAIADLRRLLVTADITAAMSVEGLLGTDRVFAADLHALRPQTGPGRGGRQPARAAGRQPDRRLAPRAGGHARAGRLLAALRAAGRRRRARHRRARRDGRRARAGGGDRQPGRHARTAASSPTATSTARPSATCSTSSRSPPPTWRACPSGAPIASSTSPATTACRRSWPTIPGVDSGYMIAQYTQAAIVSELKRLAVPGERRLDPELRHAGGPRLDGLVRRAQAAPRARRADARAGDRAADRRARDRPARAAAARPPPPAPCSPRCARRCPGPAPTVSLPLRSRPPWPSSARAAPSRAAESVTGPLEVP